MGGRAEYYGEWAERDVRVAYREVGPEIIEAQERLRSFSPNHILLPLISVNIPSDYIRFVDGFGDHVSKWTGIPRNEIGNWYVGLGHYIEQMNSETEKCRGN